MKHLSELLEKVLTKLAGDIDRKLGTAVQAIEFAQLIEDGFDVKQFLKDWSEGDLTYWPEYRHYIGMQNLIKLPANDIRITQPIPKDTD